MSGIATVRTHSFPLSQKVEKERQHGLKKIILSISNGKPQSNK